MGTVLWHSKTRKTRQRKDDTASLPRRGCLLVLWGSSADRRRLGNRTEHAASDIRPAYQTVQDAADVNGGKMVFDSAAWACVELDMLLIICMQEGVSGPG
ncbi:hypothetical protein BDV96DRAFT_655036 [Lophiotrema nucula]|uniref:Uncharacterized protein n=1 Tax=Lophiotrema nucula TaxID=690887 RepID=A0A6A5YFY4_9PLEO|nr:hypothetical protein BDV96DRAFT_655036 [Lophiotrema nucula]